jgi:hypothetical protein
LAGELHPGFFRVLKIQPTGVKDERKLFEVSFTPISSTILQ